MIMSTYITQKELVDMIQLSRKYRHDQVFVGLSKFNVKQIKLLSVEIQQQNLKLTKYYIELEEIADYFINHYAVEDSQFFKVDKRLFREIRKSFSFLIRTRFKFRPRSPYNRYDYCGKHVTYSDSSNSVLCGKNVQLDLFGKASFPVYVQILCHNFADFFSTLSKCSNLCQEVLDTEESIRKNPKLCKMLYQKDYQELLLQCKDIVNAYDIIYNIGMVDVLGNDTDEAILNGFHKLTRKQMLAHVLHNEIRKKNQIDLDDDESVLFAHQTADYVRRARYVLKNLDLLPVKGRGNTLSSVAIVFLMDKLNIKLGNEHKFYDYLKKNYCGRYTIPSYQAVNASKNHSLKRTDSEDTETLSEKYDKLWEVGISSGKEKSTKLTAVANNVYALN